MVKLIFLLGLILILLVIQFKLKIILKQTKENYYNLSNYSGGNSHSTQISYYPFHQVVNLIRDVAKIQNHLMKINSWKDTTANYNECQQKITKDNSGPQCSNSNPDYCKEEDDGKYYCFPYNYIPEEIEESQANQLSPSFLSILEKYNLQKVE